MKLGFRLGSHRDVENVLTELEKTLKLGLLNLVQSVLLSILAISGASSCFLLLLLLLFIRLSLLVITEVAFIDGSWWLRLLLLLLLHVRVAPWAETLHQAACCFCSRSSSLRHFFLAFIYF